MTLSSWIGLAVCLAWVALAAYGKWGPQLTWDPPKPERDRTDLGDVFAGLLMLPVVLAAFILMAAVYLSPLLILIWLIAR